MPEPADDVVDAEILPTMPDLVQWRPIRGWRVQLGGDGEITISPSLNLTAEQFRKVTNAVTSAEMIRDVLDQAISPQRHSPSCRCPECDPPF